MDINQIINLKTDIGFRLDYLADLERKYEGSVTELTVHVMDDIHPDRDQDDWHPDLEVLEVAMLCQINPDYTVTYGYFTLAWDNDEKTWKVVADEES